MRTVFHVSTADQLGSVARKVHNLFADESVEIDHVAVVLDRASAIDAAAGGRRHEAEAILEEGGTLEICSNAARGANRSLAELPEDVERVPSAVGELTRLQHRGYAYIRP